MKRMFISKRGVSPLAATLLLILFAIILGIATMTLGGEYFSDVRIEADIGTGCQIPLDYSLNGNLQITLRDLQITGDSERITKSVKCSISEDLGIKSINSVILTS